MTMPDAGPYRSRRWTLALASAAGLMVLAGSAQSQPITGRAPWCVNVPFHGGTRDCAYYSLAQCMESAAGVSNQCERNPWYVPERPEPRPKKRETVR